VDKELKMLRKESVVAGFKILAQHLSVGTEENSSENPHNNRSPGRELKPGPVPYEAEMLTTRLSPLNISVSNNGNRKFPW
jgi:hypothetical protein